VNKHRVRQTDRQTDTRSDRRKTIPVSISTATAQCPGNNNARFCSGIRPLPHAPETSSRNRLRKSMSDFGASFSCRCMTSNVLDCLRNLASNLGVWRGFLGSFSGACVTDYKVAASETAKTQVTYRTTKGFSL